jgi:hypothetical protein
MPSPNRICARREICELDRISAPGPALTLTSRGRPADGASPEENRATGGGWPGSRPLSLEEFRTLSSCATRGLSYERSRRSCDPDLYGPAASPGALLLERPVSARLRAGVDPRGSRPPLRLPRRGSRLTGGSWRRSWPDLAGATPGAAALVGWFFPAPAAPLRLTARIGAGRRRTRNGGPRRRLGSSAGHGAVWRCLHHRPSRDHRPPEPEHASKGRRSRVARRGRGAIFFGDETGRAPPRLRRRQAGSLPQGEGGRREGGNAAPPSWPAGRASLARR